MDKNQTRRVLKRKLLLARVRTHEEAYSVALDAGIVGGCAKRTYEDANTIVKVVLSSHINTEVEMEILGRPMGPVAYLEYWRVIKPIKTNRSLYYSFELDFIGGTSQIIYK